MSSRSERSDDIDIDISSDTEVEKDDKWKTSDFFINDNNEKYLNANIVRRSIRKEEPTLSHYAWARTFDLGVRWQIY